MKKDIKEELIVKSPLDDLIQQRYGDYAKYIIQDRALPDARDGLKPVQRRILYAMYHDGNTYDKAFRKCAKTVGLVIGNYHPHGDSSVYEAMVRMSQQWKMNHPLVDIHGNNGSIDDDPAAAMRYTEARLAPLTEKLLEDIEKDTVVWAPNFDDTENEPTVLPAMYPNLLVNGSTGIAAGYATNIPPHNLKEIVNGTIYRINNPLCSIDEMMSFIKAPDFPTGGIVLGKDGIKSVFESGKGKIILRSKAVIEETKTCQQIIITEIPYEVVKVNLVKKLDDIRFNKDIDGILDVRDESGRNGLRIVIDISKDIDANNVLNYFYKNTELQINYNYNMIAIVQQRPKLLGLLDAIDAYISFGKQVIKDRSIFEFNKRAARDHILEGLIKAVSVMDEIVSIIRSSKDKADAKDRLIKRFDFSMEQAEAIVTLRLYRLTNTDVIELREEHELIIKEMAELKEIIDSETKLKNVFCNQLTDIANKYGHDRLTAIEDTYQEIQIDKTSMIANESIIVVLSKDGYIKRVSLRSYNSSEGIMPGLKQNDQLVGFIQTTTLDTLLAFTNTGEYVCLPLYQLKEYKWKDIGDHISNYCRCDNAAKFLSGCIISNFHTQAYVISVSKKGMIKRSLIEPYYMQRTSRASSAMNLDKDDSIVYCNIAYIEDSVLLITKEGYCNKYDVRDIPEVGVKAKGVRAVKLTSNDELAYCSIIHDSKSEAVFITEKFNAKRIKINDIQNTNRATKGNLIAKKNKSNPASIIYCLCGNLSDELEIYTSQKMSLLFKDITLMDAESRFSNSITNEEFYHSIGISEVKIIDFTEENLNNDNNEKVDNTTEIKEDGFHFEEMRLEV